MSRSLDRHRLAARYRRGLDALILGDATDTALQYGSMGINAAVEIAQKERARKAAEEASKEGNEARKAATEARKKAVMAAADARTEKDTVPPGPKHQLAQQLALEADAAEAKAAYYTGGGMPPGGAQWPQAQPHTDSVMDKWWFWPAVIVGTAGAGLVAYKMIKK
jgi:hypothetical protein